MAVVSQFALTGCTLKVREDLPQSFRDFWKHLAAPGPGWSGAERVEIAAESRHAETCTLCADRKKALSPNAVNGAHDSPGKLPTPAIEAVHRISTDPGRLSNSFFETTLAAGLSDVQWVEIVGIVSALKSVDAFHRAMGAEPEPLPEPEPGSATGYRPPGATMSGAWLPMIREKDLGPNEQDLYHGMQQTGNVMRSMSLAPDEVRNLSRLSDATYLKPHEIGTFSARGNRELNRMQVELLAARVSQVNQCFY